MVNGVEIDAAELAANDIRFSAAFPEGHSLYGGETFFAETDGRRGVFGTLRMPEAAVEAHSALNALLVIATMKAIADAATHKTWDEIQRAGGIETPTGRLSSFGQEWCPRCKATNQRLGVCGDLMAGQGSRNRR